jgi:HlyD family secretion protein
VRRALPYVVVTLIVLAAGGVAALRRAPVSGWPTAAVARGEFVDFLQVRGDIRPLKSVILTAPSAGGSELLIIDLVRNGATIAAGDLVAQFDTTTEQRTLEQKQSELKQAEAEIDKAESERRRRVRAAETELEQARSAVARARLDLAQLEVKSRVEGEKLKIALAIAERHVTEAALKVEGETTATSADVAAAGQKRDKALFDVRETERIIGGFTLRAPGAGAVSLLPNMRAAGNARSAPEFKRGDRAWFGAAIAELPDLRSIQMMCRVDESDRARVRPGLATRIAVDALPDRELAGTIKDISIVAKPDFTTWPPVRNFDVAIRLDDADPRLRSGMSASARVEIDRLKDVLLAPPAGIFPRGARATAYVVAGRGVERRDVEILRRGRDQVAIRSGLREGERIVLRDLGAEGAVP